MVLSSLCVAVSADNNDPVTLNVFNWGEYISDGSEDSLDVNAEFEKYYEQKYGVKMTVNYSNYDTNETMYAKLKAGGANYDVITPSDYMISRLIKEDMLEKLDFSNIPNYKSVDEKVIKTSLSYDPNSEYSVPYTWGTAGIIYNKTMVSAPLEGWADMWDEQYAGKILMFNNPRDAYAVALSLLGYSYNTTDKAQWDAATEKLKEQKPRVQAYVADEVFNKMESGEAAIAPYYAGDFKTMQANNPDLEFVFPKEGFNVFVDAMCIPKGAKNKAAAEEYINFMCSHEIALANAETIGYSSPITSVEQDPEYSYYNDEVVYPSAEILSRGEEFLYLDADTQKIMDDGWSQVKRTEISSFVYAIVALALVAATAFIIIKRVRKKAE